MRFLQRHDSGQDLAGTFERRCRNLIALSLTLANLGSPRESGILQGKWVRREFCHCLGFAETVKKLTRPIFDASNDR